MTQANPLVANEMRKSGHIHLYSKSHRNIIDKPLRHSYRFNDVPSNSYIFKYLNSIQYEYLIH